MRFFLQELVAASRESFFLLAEESTHHIGALVVPLIFNLSSHKEHLNTPTQHTHSHTHTQDFAGLVELSTRAVS